MNFGVLDFFKFAPRMPQIAQILVSWKFSVYFFFSNSRLCNNELPFVVAAAVVCLYGVYINNIRLEGGEEESREAILFYVRVVRHRMLYISVRHATSMSIHASLP